MSNSGVVPWCQSEVPDKVKSVHNCNIAFAASFNAKSETMAEPPTYIFRQSDLLKFDIQLCREKD